MPPKTRSADPPKLGVLAKKNNLKEPTFRVRKELPLVKKKINQPTKKTTAKSENKELTASISTKKSKKEIIKEPLAEIFENQKRTRNNGSTSNISIKRSSTNIHLENEPLKKKKEIIDEIEDIDEKTLKLLLACFDPSTIPDELPCRGEEIKKIRGFIEGNLVAGTSGCSYISGVPGTGKTASVRLVMKELERRKKNLPNYVYVELNGMLVSNPKRIFVELYQELLKSRRGFFPNPKKKNVTRISFLAAIKALDRLFESADTKRPAIILLLDEIDALVTKRQQHLYRIFEWATLEESKLTVVTIANTLDLPERLLSNRIHSRMGLQRQCFPPYNHEQIEEILISRLRQRPDAVQSDAVILIARKVASVSGDIRRAFDVCRVTIQLVLSELDAFEDKDAKKNDRRKSARQRKCGHVTVPHVIKALKQMAENVKVQAIKCASTHEKLFMEAAVREYRRLGIEEMPFNRIWYHYQEQCRSDDIEEPCVDQIIDVANRLAEYRLLIRVPTSCDDRQDFTAKYRLNVNPGDVDLALKEETFYD